MKKAIDCDCNLEVPLLFEFSPACTVIEKRSPDAVYVLNNWFVDFRHEDDIERNERNEPYRTYPQLITWQCYDSCDRGNQFLEVLEKKGELIRMLHDDDDVEQDEKLQLQIFIQEKSDKNYHTFHDIEGDITLTDAVIFCYRGIQPKTCTCQPFTGNVCFQKAATTPPSLPMNSLILGSWPFSHPPRDQIPDEKKGVVLTDKRFHNKKTNDLAANNKHSTCTCSEVRAILEQFCRVQTVSILPLTTNDYKEIRPQSRPI